MSDSIWYYARGESEQGPISSAQIKALAATGALRRDDLVWKEGMENWLPASDVDELFPQNKKKGQEPEKKTAPATKDNGTPTPKPASARPSLPPDLDVPQLIRSVGRGLVVLGVLIVLMSRGCDSLGVRKAARLQALAEIAESEFQRSWDRAKSLLEDEQQSLRKRSDLNNAEQQRLNNLPEEMAKLDREKTAEQRDLRRGKWADYKIAAGVLASARVPVRNDGPRGGAAVRHPDHRRPRTLDLPGDAGRDSLQRLRQQQRLGWIVLKSTPVRPL